ncbi:methylated-DNA--[]-cysteine S-methyltransferase family protein [Burkholderia pseudomallei]|uniref:methylated-DNA--[protein]-cysteine S-methyltransferase n=1 Tax=Burkholderia pseudomallei TaxID=28450 RepID=A0AA40J7J5_BURPE|nr:methylated-DNA--[protein]-cysteine S-methyltransferase [Burkholderia pseudomallei]KGX05326.1 methylated-DNA--[]-cysteine S-methyltransferase family protein [Burkholderia pseudomallei]
MKTRSISTFKYSFRAPGSQVEGPIRFAVGQTVLGKVIVGRSRRGICAIFLGDDAQALREQLAAEFPAIELKADQAALGRELNQVIAFIDKDQSEGVINLDIGGTAFEQKVWQALCGIPSGKTRSYGDVARDLGVPEAVRAVASACAANVLAIAIPCHRVVRSDGSISGYRWGVERKRALLTDEATEEAAEVAA